MTAILQITTEAATRLVQAVVAVTALLMIVAPGNAGTISLASSTYLCTGYAECQATGYSNAGYRGAASTSYWRMYTGHNCTNYVAYRLIQNGMADRRPWEGSGNAANWGVAMASITDQTPRVGAIAWYAANVAPAGSAGHVAYIEQVISPTEIIVSEDYWGGDFHWRRITKSGSGWPSGFIHFNDAAIESTVAPTLTGSPMVGAPLEVATGTWSPAPASVAVRWLADGVAIPGATTTSYVPTPEDKGKILTAEVTAGLPGYTSGAAVLTTAPVSPGVLQPTTLPAIQGNPEVGQALTLSSTSWSPQPLKTTTQWYADGVAVPGATDMTLVLGRDQIDRRITARVIGSAKGYRKSITSAPETAPVLAKPVTIKEPFVVTGRTRVGRLLTAEVGAMRPSKASATYTWLRDGKPIGKTSRRTYTVRRADVGSRLSVQVTLTHDNYRATTQVFDVSRPVLAVPKMKIRLQPMNGRVAVTVRVRAPGAPAPTGALTVNVGGRTTAGQLDGGLERVVVRDLGPGRKRVVVRYAGTDLVEGATESSAVTIPPRRS